MAAPRSVAAVAAKRYKAESVALVVFLFGAFGLIVGSFLNVVIYRVPARISIVRPGSACPACATPIAARDNVPVLSWLVLRGRCRRCAAPISARYPLVELGTGVLFAVLALRFGAGWTLPAELLLGAGLLALAVIDAERLLLPRTIVYTTLGLVGAVLLAAAAATGDWGRLGTAAACGAGWFAVFFAVNFARPAWLGFGDVRLAFLLGLALGWVGPWYPLIGFMAANLAGALVGVGLIAAGRAKMTSRLPYGVFLAVGAVLALLIGPGVISGYRHLLHH